MTIPENGWGYQKEWMGHWKTPDELIEMLAKCVSLDGNFVLNFGPKPDGTFRKKEIADAKAIGDWMKINSEAIYNCGHIDWAKQDWGYFTQKRNDATGKVYMLVFNVPVSGVLRVDPAKNISVQNARLLNGNKELKIEKSDGNTFLIHLQRRDQNQPFVIVLQTEKSKQKSNEEKAKT